MTDRHDAKLSSRDFVQSLERGLAVIQAFDADHPTLTAPEVARRGGLSAAATRRFLLTLQELGLVRVDDGRYSLRPGVLRLGYAYLSSLELPDVALPHLRDLSNRTSESVSLTVLDDGSVVYVAQVTASRPMAVRIDVGTRFPAYATAAGRVLLSSLTSARFDEYLANVRLDRFTEYTVPTVDALRESVDDVRTKGYAIVERELDSSLRAIAVPVRDREGRVIAALPSSTHTAETRDSTQLAHLLGQLRDTAAQIESDLAPWPPRPSWLP